VIPVTKPYLPSREKLDKYIDGIYERQWLTNNGPLVQELTLRLEDYLGVDNLLLVANGTLALQVAYRVLGVTDSVSGKPAEAITTPFTFVATASSLKWEGVQPVFADIDPKTWCLAPANIGAKVTPQTRAIVPVHVFGNACDVDAIQSIAAKHDLKIIYDACHAFGVSLNGESLLGHGDAAILSFHATKLFHTVEGGAIIFRRKEDLERAREMINFGITGPDAIVELGINAKMNEFQGAMGLCVLDEMEENLGARKAIWRRYQQRLGAMLDLQVRHKSIDYNYAYFPVLFNSEAQALSMAAALKEKGIMARRYFYPSLESLTFLDAPTEQSISKDIAQRILCLPIFGGLGLGEQLNIIECIEEGLKI
jgi:dTDP-4-amino-4,6-dideoxygalactose transaminase